MTDDTRSPAGSRKPADIRDQAIEALRVALPPWGENVSGHTVPRMDVDVAADLVANLDAHPEAKAALAAWLCDPVLDYIDRIQAARDESNRARAATQPVVADTTEEEK